MQDLFGRKRGYYRAVKRKEPWALEKELLLLRSPLQWFMWWVYRPKILRDLVYSKNPFLVMLSKDEPKGAYIPVPLKYNGRP